MKIKKIASVILAVSLICMSINIDTNSFTKAETVSFTIPCGITPRRSASVITIEMTSDLIFFMILKTP